MTSARSTLTAVAFDSRLCVVPGCPEFANAALKGPLKNKCDRHAEVLRLTMREGGARASKNAGGLRFGRYDGELVALGKELLPILRRVERTHNRRIRAEDAAAEALSDLRRQVTALLAAAGAVVREETPS